MRPATWTLDPLKMPPDQRAHVRLLLDGYTKVDGDCRIWTGDFSKQSPAFSMVVHNARGRYMVRRLVWMLERGAIRPGYVLVAGCGDERCIAHGQLRRKADITAENLKRTATRRLIAIQAAARRNARLTLQDVQAIRASAAPSKELAKVYGVHARHLNAIRRGDCWRAAEFLQLEAA